MPFFFDNSNDTKNIIFVNSGRLNVINSEFDWRLPQNWGNTIAIKLITILRQKYNHKSGRKKDETRWS